jgi:hypothetical protein
MTVLFDLRHPEQREALDFFRSAFAESAALEAVSADLFVLHIWPGVVRRGREGESV